MSSAIVQFGTQIASEVRDRSPQGVPVEVPQSLQDLLRVWEADPPKEVKMLRSTVALLCEYFEKPLQEIGIWEVERTRSGFRGFLVRTKRLENSIRSYVNYVRILLKSAEAAGWSKELHLSTEWQTVISLADKQRCGALARHLSGIRQTPQQVSTEDVEAWIAEVSRERLAHSTAASKRLPFWRILRDLGFTDAMPKCLLREKNYGIPLTDFPPDFRKEMEEILAWKQKEYAWDRPKEARHRKPTAKRLKHIVCALYGFAVNVLEERAICSLAQLLRQDILGRYFEWAMGTREVQGDSLQRNFRLVAAVLRQHPRYKGLQFEWLDPMLDGLPTPPDSVLQQRKAEKTLPYTIIEGIPALMKSKRAEAAKRSEKEVALLVRDEFMVRFFSVLPWRQRNLRECRIAGAKPNLYKGPIPEITTMDLPEWVVEQKKADPTATFWQFHFTELETKTDIAVDAVLPKQLVGPLEEYLQRFRQHLLVGPDPGTLFVNESGRQMSLHQVTHTISQTTLTYGGRRVTPHPFRDIVCRAWLKDHPKDYLTLSKLLWHSSPNEVIRTYGSLFNESSGVCSMESWLDERATRKGK